MRTCAVCGEEMMLQDSRARICGRKSCKKERGRLYTASHILRQLEREARSAKQKSPK